MVRPTIQTMYSRSRRKAAARIARGSMLEREAFKSIIVACSLGNIRLGFAAEGIDFGRIVTVAQGGGKTGPL
jgi:hypothetical protein